MPSEMSGISDLLLLLHWNLRLHACISAHFRRKQTTTLTWQYSRIIPEYLMGGSDAKDCIMKCLICNLKYFTW